MRVMGVRAGCCQERLTGNTGIIVDMGVISFPTMQQGPEWAYVGRSQGPHRVAQKHKTLNRSSSEGERKAAKRFGFSVFPICT